jgi:hypothetical protein
MVHPGHLKIGLTTARPTLEEQELQTAAIALVVKSTNYRSNRRIWDGSTWTSLPKFKYSKNVLQLLLEQTEL